MQVSAGCVAVFQPVTGEADVLRLWQVWHVCRDTMEGPIWARCEAWLTAVGHIDDQDERMALAARSRACLLKKGTRAWGRAENGTDLRSLSNGS